MSSEPESEPGVSPAGSNRITLSIDGRVVYWDLPAQIVIMLAQQLVAGLGPAREDVDGETREAH